MSNLKKTDFLFILVALFIGTAGFLYLDQQAALFFKTSTPNDIHEFFKAITDLALAWPYFLIAILGASISRLLAYSRPQFTRWKNRFLFLLYSLIISGLTVTFLKIGFGRRRPNDLLEYQPNLFQPFNFDWNFHSLPSGHSQVAFCVAIVISIYFPRLKIPALLAASILALSRIVVTSHFFSDTVMGTTIGILVPILLMRKYRRKFI